MCRQMPCKNITACGSSPFAHAFVFFVDRIKSLLNFWSSICFYVLPNDPMRYSVVEVNLANERSTSTNGELPDQLRANPAVEPPTLARPKASDMAGRPLFQPPQRMQRSFLKWRRRIQVHTYIHTYILYWLVPTGLFRVNFTLQNYKPSSWQ